MVIKSYILAGIAGVALSFGAPAALAFAHTDLWFGGNTDCTSQGYMHAGANPNPNDRNVPIVYGTCDGAFAPFLGSTAAPDAIKQGVDAGQVAWKANCTHGESCTLHGFSIGAAPATIVASEVGADRPGSNTHLITEGNAWDYSGVFGEAPPGFIGTWINVGAPAIGVPLHIDQVPNSENRLNPNDGWANNSGQTPSAEITQLGCINGCDDNIPPQHYIQQGTPTAEFDSPDGVHQKVYGEPLFGVVAPQDNPMVNPPVAVHNDVPSFFGEAPCEGGYFTPGDAPC